MNTFHYQAADAIRNSHYAPLSNQFVHSLLTDCRKQWPQRLSEHIRASSMTI